MRTYLVVFAFLASSSALALDIGKADGVSFTIGDNAASPSSFEPGTEISLTKRGKTRGETIVIKSYGVQELGNMLELADANAMFNAAYEDGARVDIGDGSLAAVVAARDRIKARKLADLTPFARNYISGLQQSLYNVQNNLQECTFKANSCKSGGTKEKSPSPAPAGGVY